MKAGDHVETNAAFKRETKKVSRVAGWEWRGKVLRQSGEKCWLVEVEGMPRPQRIAEKFLTVVKKGKKS